MSHYYNSTKPLNISLGSLLELFSGVIRFIVLRYKKHCMDRRESTVEYIENNEDRKVVRILDYINQNFHSSLTAADIARNCYCSESYLNHTFKREIGVNIREYINNLRIKYAVLYLKNTERNVTDIAYSIGFNDSNYFSKVFTRHMGVSPREFRKLHRRPA